MYYETIINNVLISGDFFSISLHLGVQTQNDTLYAYLSQTPVVIDGSADDACWEDVRWHPVAQAWIPYDATMNEGDFHGRHKLAIYSQGCQN